MTVPILLPALVLAGAAPPAAQEIPVTQVQPAAPATPEAVSTLDAAPAEQDPTAPGKPPHAKGDPLEGFNRDMFSVHQAVDKAVLRPAAMGYRHVVPKPVRSGLRNVISNLGEPIVFLNDLLQLKPGRAFRTFTRFATNTTMGLGGLFDVAKSGHLPHRDNGLGNTLAYYGVKSGPYMFLPLFGPTTLRDLVGGQADGLVLPLTVGKPFSTWKYVIAKGVVAGLDLRAESDTELKALFQGAVDPYATLRSVYLQNRAGEIAALKGKKGGAPDDIPLDDLEDPGAPSAEPAPAAPQS